MAESKAVYTLVDTEMVRDYVTSNLCDLITRRMRRNSTWSGRTLQ